MFPIWILITIFSPFFFILPGIVYPGSCIDRQQHQFVAGKSFLIPYVFIIESGFLFLSF